MVDEDRKAGTADKIKGTVKEQVGKLTGDEEKQAEGNAQKNKGKVQNKVGEAKDKVRDKL
ncbi:CsbD family protein [Salinisphaera sp. Q1T1-3]|uniref:CsbD family protein n=1 Tax=Salinisphaera sp. Q1T1-3 TaxID=2321229 RepID=UPI000E727DF6|nr:CsbD family protein [Salinisphaera sp. Q1T1-3]RJS91608.1 CsbD family protein [Salinisphaera sp. Q1T1-3]